MSIAVRCALLLQPTPRQLLIVATLAVLPLVAPIASTAAPTDTPRAAIQESCQRGQAWLVAAQQADGSWGSGAFRGSVAITATATMALVGSGSTPTAGPQSRAVMRGVEFLIESAAPDGLIHGNEQAAHGVMYGHSFATLVLAEVYGETADDKALATILDRARALIEKTQNAEGGWRYQPERGEADGSVTAGMVVALRGLHNSGFAVSQTTVERAIVYLKQLQNDDGGFRYQSAAGASAQPRTAAALFAIQVAGVGSKEAIDRGFDWLKDHSVRLGLTSPLQANDGYALYGLSYAAAAFWQRGGSDWKEWYSQAAPTLLQAQKTDGSWLDPSCPEYGTAAALYVLQMPNNLTPLFQRELESP